MKKINYDNLGYAISFICIQVIFYSKINNLLGNEHPIFIKIIMTVLLSLALFIISQILYDYITEEE